MSKTYALNAATRNGTGKGVARALRRQNRVPAVIYGDKKEPLIITLDDNEINLEYRKGRMFVAVCDLDVEGQKHMVLARDVQVHPVTDNVTHVDFLRVTPTTKIEVFVPVHFINEEDAPGLKEKGILNIVRHEFEVICLAQNIPDHIDVNMAGKAIDDTIRVSDAILPEGVQPVIKRNFAIATITEPKAFVEEAPVVEGDAAAVPTEGDLKAAAEAAEAAAAGPAPKAEKSKKE